MWGYERIMMEATTTSSPIVMVQLSAHIVRLTSLLYGRIYVGDLSIFVGGPLDGQCMRIDETHNRLVLDGGVEYLYSYTDRQDYRLKYYIYVDEKNKHNDRS